MDGKKFDKFANENGLKFEHNNVQKTLTLSTSTYNTGAQANYRQANRLKLKTVLKSTLPNPFSHAGYLGKST